MVVAVVIVTAAMEVGVIAVEVAADSVAGMADATAGMAVGVTATEAVGEVAMMAEGNFEDFIKVLRSPSVTAQWVSICFCSKIKIKITLHDHVRMKLFLIHTS